MRCIHSCLMISLGLLALSGAAFAQPIVTQNDAYRIWRGAINSGDTAQPQSAATQPDLRLFVNVAEPVCSGEAMTNGAFRLRVGLLAVIDCNANGTPDYLDIAMGASQDCNSNAVPDECECPDDCNANGTADCCEPDTDGDGVIDACDSFLPRVLCDNLTIADPGLLGFTDDGFAATNACVAYRCFRLFAGQQCQGSCKIWRIKQDRPGCFPGIPVCTPQGFGPTLPTPESLVIDVTGVVPDACNQPNQIIVGADNTLYFVRPTTGVICALYPDPAFAGIGQMAIDSNGRLFIGSVNGDCLNLLTNGVVSPFYCCAPAEGPPRALAVDEQDNVYLACSGSGVVVKLAPDGTVLDPVFATGCQGAIGMAFARPGLFHGNLFVACGDRVMEVNAASGDIATLFLDTFQMAGVTAHGIAVDPEGYLYVSDPGADRILKIGPGIPGDMNGDAAVDFADISGFVEALLQLPEAPLPILTADMNCDGCVDGEDIQPFVEDVLAATIHAPCMP